MLTNVVVIGLLILANGFFAAVEMAVGTARRKRLKTLAEAGEQLKLWLYKITLGISWLWCKLASPWSVQQPRL